MQSAQPRQFDDVAVVGWFDRARVWRVLIQCPVSSVSVIVVEIAIQTPAEVMLAEHNDVVQALAPDGSNQAFDHRAVLAAWKLSLVSSMPAELSNWNEATYLTWGIVDMRNAYSAE